MGLPISTASRDNVRLWVLVHNMHIDIRKQITIAVYIYVQQNHIIIRTRVS